MPPQENKLYEINCRKFVFAIISEQPMSLERLLSKCTNKIKRRVKTESFPSYPTLYLMQITVPGN